VSQENIARLREDYPELANTLHATTDLYSKAVSAYTLIKQFAESCTGELAIFDIKKLVETQAQQLNLFLQTRSTNNVLLVFPGEGGQVIKRLLLPLLPPVSETQVLDLQCERIVESGRVLGVRVNALDKPLIVPNKQDIIVIDDVIVTGSTLNAIRETITEQSFKEALPQFFASSLFTLSPQKTRRYGNNGKPAGIFGYNTILTAALYEGESGTPPLNTISTFIGSSPKSKEVIQRYASKYAANIDLFSQSLSLMQRSSQI
jgi:hypothetical protein